MEKVLEERMRCVNDVCPQCRDRLPTTFNESVKHYVHEVAIGGMSPILIRCAATGIWSRHNKDAGHG